MSRRAVLALEVVARLAIIVVVIKVVKRDPFTYDVGSYWSRFHSLGTSNLPYRDFLWEFPPLTIVAVLPAKVLGLGAFRLLFASLMAACELASLELLRRQAPERWRATTVAWSVLALPLVPFGYFRLDFLSVLAATLGLVALLQRRSVAPGATLGFAAKLWPGALVAGAALQRRWRDVTASIVGIAVVLGAWVAWSPSGFRDFLDYRHGSGLQIESLFGAVRLAGGATVTEASDAFVVDAGKLGWVDGALFAALAVTVLALLAFAWRRGADRVDIPALVGCMVASSLLLSRILSPQYLLWLLPFIALAYLDGERVAAACFFVASGSSLVVLWRYSALVADKPEMVAIVLLRNALLVVLTFALGRWAFRSSSVAADGGSAANA